MRRTIDLRGRQVYLAGPRTWVEPDAWAAVQGCLLDLGLLEQTAEDSFRVCAAALRAAGAEVFSPWEQATALGEDADSRAARAADRDALFGADLVVVLDGWADVPGAVDAARIVAASRGVAWAVAGDVRSGIGHASAA